MLINYSFSVLYEFQMSIKAIIISQYIFWLIELCKQRATVKTYGGQMRVRRTGRRRSTNSRYRTKVNEVI